MERIDHSGRTPLEVAVSTVLDSLERGDVATYGEVAEEAGYPRCARAVGNFLSRSSGFPWWRVVNARGRLAPGHERSQENLLRQEGVAVKDGYVVGMRRRRS